MLRSYRVEAFVLRRVKKGESDSYYTLLTRRHGLLRVLAKGIRKINSRRAPYLDLFNHLVIYLAKGKNIDIVTDITPIENYAQLKLFLSRVASAFKMAELTDRLLPEGVYHPEIFDKMHNTFQLLNQKNNIEEGKLIEEYSLYLLQNLGYIPQSQILKGKDLDRTLEEIMEKKIKANILLSKLL